MRWCDEGAVFKKPPDTASEKMKQNQRPTLSALCVRKELIIEHGKSVQPMATLLSQRPSKAKFVTIRVGQVEEPLSPFGIARCRVRTVAGRDHTLMEGVNIRMIKDCTSPPRPTSLLGDEIKIATSGPKARKRCVVATVNDLKSQHAIEADGTRHAVGG
jgi:hypothetical protein